VKVCVDYSDVCPNKASISVNVLVKVGLVSRSQSIILTDVFVVGVGSYFWVVRGVIVAKDTLIITNLRISVVNPHRISQFCADDFVEIQK
jgi:hypothetical protein